jgi:hypothetical protein
MGMDPLTLGLGASAVGGLVGAYGQKKQGDAATQRFNQIQTQGQGMMKKGQDPYASAIMQLVSGRQAPGSVGTGSGAIDIGSVMGNANPGNDALMQFLRSDPSRQTQFDASPAFASLQAMDQRTQDNAVAGLNANFRGLGQRFGTGAMRQTSDLLANLGAQTGVRNAGIMQSSFENAQTRRMQGLGLQLQGATALGQQGNQMAQIAAQLGIANQGNQQWNQQFNQNNANQFFQQQMQGMGMASGMQNQQDDFNARLFAAMSGQPMPQGNGYTALGGAMGDVGQMAAFLPMLQQMSQRPGTNMIPAGGGYNWGPGGRPQIQSPMLNPMSMISNPYALRQ